MLIKVCGLKHAEQVKNLDSMVDFIGFIFYDRSPRYIQSPPESKLAKRVGVFVNASVETIRESQKKYKLDYIQLHGDESPSFCMAARQFAKVIKAFPISTDFNFSVTNNYEESADFFLFDTKTVLHGGSGKTFDWELLQSYKGSTPFLLSGGIGPESIDSLHSIKHPQLIGIDLNSRFEIKPGIKDLTLCTSFIDSVKNSTPELISNHEL